MTSMQAAVAHEIVRERLAVAERHRLARRAVAARRARRRASAARIVRATPAPRSGEE